MDLSLIAEFNCLFKNVKYGARMCGCDLRPSLKQLCDLPSVGHDVLIYKGLLWCFSKFNHKKKLEQ